MPETLTIPIPSELIGFILLMGAVLVYKFISSILKAVIPV